MCFELQQAQIAHSFHLEDMELAPLFWRHRCLLKPRILAETSMSTTVQDIASL